MLTYGEATREIPLPFIRRNKRGRIEGYWSVTPTGDWFEDSKLGTEYAFNWPPCIVPGRAASSAARVHHCRYGQGGG